MEQPVRALNEEGVDRFESYIRSLAENGRQSPPKALLFDPDHSTGLAFTATVEEKDFASRLEAMRYLVPALKPLGNELEERFEGIWSWLTLFYFDQLCPEKGGKRSPGEIYSYIPGAGYLNRHRHLLAAPYRMFKRHGEGAVLLLDTPLDADNPFQFHFVSRPSFAFNPAVLDAATRLYYDGKRRRPKPGALLPEKAGGLIRFVDVVEQLELTHDLHSLDGEQVLSLLPKEFQPWRRA